MRFPYALKSLWGEALSAERYPRQLKPTVLQFPINDICNSRCQMCEIWKQKRNHELQADDIAHILSAPIFQAVTHVGINGGEPTLRPDFAAVCEATVSSLSSLRGVSLITNALREQQVISAVEHLCLVCARHGVRLTVMVSVDGVGAVHDRVRGRPGNFQSAERVIDYLMAKSDVESRIGCTVIRENVLHVDELLDWAREKEIYARFRLGIPHPRLYTYGKAEPFALNYEEKFHFANFLDYLVLEYEKSESRKAFYRSLRNQMIYGMPRAAGCAWKNHGVTLTSRGGLAYCAVASRELGNLSNWETPGEDGESLYWGNYAHLREIQETKCSSCLHDYEGYGSRRIIAQEMLSKLLRRLPRPMGEAILETLRTTRNSWFSFSTFLKRITDQFRLPQAPPALKSTDAKRILLMGWYGTETLGDKAILAGIVERIRARGTKVEVSVASLEPYITRRTIDQMPELAGVRLLDAREGRRLLRENRFDIVAVAGGPLMSAVNEVNLLAQMMSLARAMKLRTALLGCGLGPLFPSPNNWAIRTLLQASEHIILRDRRSQAIAEEIAPACRQRIRVAEDPASYWVAKAALRALPQEKRTEAPTVCLALRDWRLQEYPCGLSRARAEAIKKRFEEELRVAADALYQRCPEAIVVPFCMHKYAQGGDDRHFYARLFGSGHPVLRHLDRRHRRPSEDLEILASADAMLSMRFHSLVFGRVLGIPTAAIDYTGGGKVTSYAREHCSGTPVYSLEEFSGRQAAEDLMRLAQQSRDPVRRLDTRMFDEACESLLSN